ncbi:MAG: LAGLIDADG family homing endonuclease, partial [Candidatus Kariarchaeaceae archaeon]
MKEVSEQQQEHYDRFILETDFTPKGDQPEAITQLVEGYQANKKRQTLLGATGTGKSLDYNEFIIIKNNENLVEKLKIGEFVENNLSTPIHIADTKYQNITGNKIISFNPKSYEISEKNIIEVSKHKEDKLYQIIFDDNSEIKVTADHNCFRIVDGELELISTTDLTMGDYLPLSNFIPLPDKKIQHINLFDYGIEFKLNIHSLIMKNENIFDITRNNLKGNEYAPNWKVKQIVNQTKERGLTYQQVTSLLLDLDLDLTQVYKDINIITYGGDSVNPLIPVDNEFLTVTGLYVAEGHNSGKYILISNSDARLQSICKKYFDRLGVNYYQRNQNDIAYHSIILSKFYRIFGTKADNKRIPDFVYNLSNEQLEVFLKAMYDGDGWVEKNQVCYLSASKELIFDVRNLLLRFGITSRISKKWNTKYQKFYYEVVISGRNNLIKFQERISFSLKYKIVKLQEQIKEFGNTNVDLFPNSSRYLKSLRVRKQLSQKQLAEIAGCSRQLISLIENGKRMPSKDKIRKIAEHFKISKLYNLLEFNFRKIVEINEVASSNGFVYDIAVEDNENFMAGNGGLLVHNTF